MSERLYVTADEMADIIRACPDGAEFSFGPRWAALKVQDSNRQALIRLAELRGVDAEKIEAYRNSDALQSQENKP